MDGARLCGVEHRMTRMICGVRVIDRVLIDVLCDRIGVFLKIEDMIIQSCLRGIIMSCVETPIHKYMRSWKLKQLGKEEGPTKEILRLCKEGFGTLWLKKRG